MRILTTTIDKMLRQIGVLLGILSAITSAQPPGPIFCAQGNGFNRAEKLFGSRTADLASLSAVFNTVMLSPGDPQLVADAAAAGLKVLLEFDYKWDYIQGTDITAKVQRIVDQVKANPSAIAGISVADRLNSWADTASGRPAIPPDKMVEYLSLTGGVFHKEIPGVPVYSDVEDQELTCGQTGQSSCALIQPGSTSIYRYEKNDILVQLKNTGYVDGFFIADNIKGDGSNAWDAAAQRVAWRTVRALLPKPFFIAPRTSRLSFYQDTYPFDSLFAYRQTQVAIAVPLEEGADGIDLWGWHIPWTDNSEPTVRTWLDKDASSNVLWRQMQALAEQYRQSATSAGVAAGSRRGNIVRNSITTRAGGSLVVVDIRGREMRGQAHPNGGSDVGGRRLLVIDRNGRGNSVHVVF